MHVLLAWRHCPKVVHNDVQVMELIRQRCKILWQRFLHEPPFVAFTITFEALNGMSLSLMLTYIPHNCARLARLFRLPLAFKATCESTEHGRKQL
jgi:hypothetical protein